ncbi:MAG TPA: PAS domain-containing protein [Geminicoccaceae bacterium]|nr:PAS domain-containing protein [Geminicoccaceae bacterium]
MRPRRLRAVLIDDPATAQGETPLLEDLLGPAGELVVAAGFDDVGAGEGAAAAVPDLVLFEPEADGCDDLAALDRLRARFPDARFAAFSRRCTAFDAHRLLRAGLHGYLFKGEEPGVLRAAISLILAGGTYVPPCTIGDGPAVGDGTPACGRNGVSAFRGIVFRRALHPDGRLTYPYIWTAGPQDAFPLDRETLDRGAEAILEAMHPADRAAWWAGLQASAHRLTPHCAEFRFRDQHGRWRWYRSVGRPFRAADGGTVWDGYSADITEEKEASLRSREDRLRAIFDGTFQFIGLASPEGILLEVNQTALDFDRRSYTEAVGRPIWEAPSWGLSERHRERVREAVGRAAAGEFVRYEVDMLSGDGRVATIDFSIKPVSDDHGRVTFLIAEGRDVSSLPAGNGAQRPAAGADDHPAAEIEGRLRDSGRRLEAIIGNLPGAAFRGARGPNGEPTFLFVSRGIADIAGITPEQLLANPAALYDLVHPEDLPGHLAAIQESYRTLQPFNRTFRIITPAGGLRWLRSTGQPWRTRSGEIVSDGVIVDITHQLETEERLRQRERILGALTDNLPAVVLRCVLWPDGRSRCTFVAGDLESLTGLSVESVLDGSMPLSSRIHPEDRTAHRAAYGRAAAELGELDHEYRFVMPDGEVRWLRWIARMRPGPRGRVFADGVLLDVTEHRRALEALDRRNRDLLSLCRISEIALSSTSLDAGFRAILGEVNPFTGFTSVAIGLYDEANQVVEYRYIRWFDCNKFERPARVPLERSAAAEVVRNGRIVIERRCLERDEPHLRRMREVGEQTYVGVPIRIGQRVIGCFALTAVDDVELDPQLVELASSWADYIASFIASQGAEEVPALVGPDRHGEAFEAAFASRLTPRQRDVLVELAKGRSNKGIAVELGLQEATVKIHVRAILKALGAANRTQAANIANAVMGGIRPRPKRF